MVAPRVLKKRGVFKPSEVVNYMMILSPARAEALGVTVNSQRVLALMYLRAGVATKEECP